MLEESITSVVTGGTPPLPSLVISLSSMCVGVYCTGASCGMATAAESYRPNVFLSLLNAIESIARSLARIDVLACSRDRIGAGKTYGST
jgi:hypothetical protein